MKTRIYFILALLITFILHFIIYFLFCEFLLISLTSVTLFLFSIGVALNFKKVKTINVSPISIKVKNYSAYIYGVDKLMLPILIIILFFNKITFDVNEDFLFSLPLIVLGLSFLHISVEKR